MDRITKAVGRLVSLLLAVSMYWPEDDPERLTATAYGLHTAHNIDPYFVFMYGP